MRFTRIALENWRNFGHIDVALQNRAFLVGPNASGKSNFLDAFRFLHDLVVPGGGFQQAVQDRRRVAAIRNFAASQTDTVAIEVELLDDKGLAWHYRLAFNSDESITKEEVWTSKRTFVSRPERADLDDLARLRQTALEQVSANREFRTIADFFQSIEYFHLVPQIVRDPERKTAQKKEDPFGGDFLTQFANTIDGPTQREIRKTLKAVVPQLINIGPGMDRDYFPHLRVIFEDEHEQDERDLSDGTLRLIGLLWSLQSGEGPLLFEEPELSLHPAIVRMIPQMMLAIQRERQITRQTILSTHSSDLLSDEGIAPDEILLFLPGENDTDVKTGVELDEIRTLLQTGLPPGEVVIPYTAPENTDRLATLGNDD
jgi:predicted ATPase